uniref:Uncharacterized protein n=1 Tax=Lepeophtheirus salmonis TaxID=72036 RepID=A0A0K2VIA4_LEPSM
MKETQLLRYKIILKESFELILTVLSPL